MGLKLQQGFHGPPPTIEPTILHALVANMPETSQAYQSEHSTWKSSYSANQPAHSALNEIFPDGNSIVLSHFNIQYWPTYDNPPLQETVI